MTAIMENSQIEGLLMPWYENGDISKITSTPKERILCFDIETTGFSTERDEILQISLLNGNGDVLFSDYVKPAFRKTWAKSQEVHGITPKWLKINKPWKN